jgi:integrase
LTKRKVAKKPSTIATDRGRIERHIKPLLGKMVVVDVDRTDIDKFLHDVATGKTAARIKTGRYGLARVDGGKGTATRTLGLLGAIFAYAVRNRVRTDNPCSLIVKFADNRRERRLSDDEYAALGAALRAAEAASMWPPAVAAVRFLGLTGWRSGEALGLCQTEIDLARRTARLADTKTGFSLRPLSNAACDVLSSLPTIAGEPIFPATRGAVGTTLHLKKFWPKIAKLAALPADVTPNVLRHSYASLAADLGYGEPTIAALIGHKGQTITSRYVHSADAVLLAAADAVADRTAELMGEKKPEAEVVPLRAAR